MLAHARQTEQLAFVTHAAPKLSAAAIVAAFPDEPIASWTNRDVTYVGVGIARELRGHGATRFADVIAAARAIDTGTATPKFFGGAAFAPGAADHAPWTTFGDAWFALPRWTYCSDGTLVLADDGRDSHAELQKSARSATSRCGRSRD